MKTLFASLALCLSLAGTAFAQAPTGLPNAASAKAAADKAQAKAAADTAAAKAGADTAANKAAANPAGAKDTAEAAAKGAGTKAQADATAAKTDAVDKTNAAGAAAKSLLDLNTAPEADLAALPGVGPDNAQKIVAARPFARKDQLVSKKILSKETYNNIKNLIVAKKPAKK
jgi:DNA uptake protein ComE-like DNA-binding protein